MTVVEVRGPPCTLLRAGVAAVSRGIAAAQAAVRVFGNIDLHLTSLKVPGATNLAMDQGSYLLPSRFGFHSDEQLGSGFAASSWLEGAVVPDTDATASAFTRRSRIGLSSEELSEIRLGRDYKPTFYKPTFWNSSSFSPFGTVGAGGSSNIIEGSPLGLGRATTQQRASNAASYFLPPDLGGGVHGQFMPVAGEGIEGARCTGGRLDCEARSLNVTAAFDRAPAASLEAVGQPSRRAYETANLGGTYDFGAGRVYVFRDRQELESERQTSTLFGVAIPAWGGTGKATLAPSVLSMRPVSMTDQMARQLALGYVHASSQRTVHCGTWSRIANEGEAAYATGDTSPEGRPNGTSSALQIRINHAF